MGTLDDQDYYRVLGIERKATAAQIKDAFRKFALQHHPDRLLGEPPATQAEAAALYRRGAEAYRVLTDPKKREEYDAGLAQGKKRYALGARPKRTTAPSAVAQPPPAAGQRPSMSMPAAGRASVPAAPPRPSVPAAARPVKESAKPFVTQAEAAAKAGKWQMAVMHMQIALRHDADHPALRERLAELERKQKEK
jgi:curved DNA-binding protein CbpA